MVKFFARFFVVVLIFVISFQIASAGYFSSFFGGRIVSIEAVEIWALEASGYDCDLQGGQSFTLNITRGQSSYFIPSSTTSRNRVAPAINQKILGRSRGETVITCTNTESESQDTVSLPTVTLFGVSRQ